MGNRIDRLKILHVINGFGFGGAETWLLEIVKLNNGFHQIDFLLTGGVKRELDGEFDSRGSKLYYLKYSRKGILSFRKQFRKIVSSEGYDIIHDHEDFVAGWHWLFLLNKLPRVRIAHAHNSTVYVDNYLKTRSRKIFYHFGRLLSSRFSTKITGTSDRLMNELKYDRRRYLPKRIEPLYCGSKPELFIYDELRREEIRAEFGITKQEKVVVFIGRIGLVSSIYKNPKYPEFAFELAQSIARREKGIKFLFVGHKGDLGIQFEQSVRQKGLADRIFFLGTRADVPSLLSAADLMLFTSTTEPFGLILVEAQFNGLPIVASDIITKEIIQFPELFTLLNLNNTEKEIWEERIIERINQDSNRKEFCAVNRDEILNSKFSIQKSFDRLISHYK